MEGPPTGAGLIRLTEETAQREEESLSDRADFSIPVDNPLLHSCPFARANSDDPFDTITSMCHHGRSFVDDRGTFDHRLASKD
jgi:hypothetical protein